MAITTIVRFNIEGFGTYRGNENSNPIVGEKGEFNIRKGNIYKQLLLKLTRRKHTFTLFKTHPYEEVAYDIVTFRK